MNIKSICLKCNRKCVNKKTCDKTKFVNKTVDRWKNKGINQKRIIGY